MVMNKKGFLKILEAIVAIVIVLGFVISIMPLKSKENAKFPPDLDQTLTSILKEIQNNPKFRQCVIMNNAGCINNYIDYLSFPVQAHPWKYAIRLCKVNSTAFPVDCDYYPPIQAQDLKTKEQKFIHEVLPTDKDIYAKDTAITYPDVSGFDVNKIDKVSVAPIIRFGSSIKNCGVTSSITYVAFCIGSFTPREIGQPCEDNQECESRNCVNKKCFCNIISNLICQFC